MHKAILRDEAKVLQGFFGETTNYRGTLYDGNNFISEHIKDRMKSSLGQVGPRLQISLFVVVARLNLFDQAFETAKAQRLQAVGFECFLKNAM